MAENDKRYGGALEPENLIAADEKKKNGTGFLGWFAKRNIPTLILFCVLAFPVIPYAYLFFSGLVLDKWLGLYEISTFTLWSFVALAGIGFILANAVMVIFTVAHMIKRREYGALLIPVFTVICEAIVIAGIAVGTFLEILPVLAGTLIAVVAVTIALTAVVIALAVVRRKDKKTKSEVTSSDGTD